jgi:hypothetical protein
MVRQELRQALAVLIRSLMGDRSNGGQPAKKCQSPVGYVGVFGRVHILPPQQVAYEAAHDGHAEYAGQPIKNLG